MYENSTRIPMIILGTKENKKVNKGSTSNRLVGLADVMPTLLDLANVKIPSSCNGQSMFDSQPRKNLYAEANEGINATRMITNDQYKLVWYPHGNIFQLFDLKNDPKELIDVSLKSDFQNQLNKLKTILADNLYGDDLAFLNKKDLVGIPTNISNEGKPSLGLLGERELLGQRGMHYPPPPISE